MPPEFQAIPHAIALQVPGDWVGLRLEAELLGHHRDEDRLVPGRQAQDVQELLQRQLRERNALLVVLEVSDELGDAVMLLRILQGLLSVLAESGERLESGLKPELVPQLGGYDLDRVGDPLGNRRPGGQAPKENKSEKMGNSSDYSR